MTSVELSATELSVLTELVHDLAVAAEPQTARRSAVRHLMVLLEADHLASYEWDARGGRYAAPVTVNQDPANIERYLSWFQFRDPLTPAMRVRAQATLTDEVLPHPALARTEFYADFLARDGLHHGVNLFVTDGGRHLADLRVWRACGRPAFTGRDLALLDAVAPHLRSALTRLPRQDAAVDAGPGVRLTPRELQVAVLAARGCTDRAIGSSLGISFATVRTHLSRAMEKTGSANRTELAARLARQQMC